MTLQKNPQNSSQLLKILGGMTGIFFLIFLIFLIWMNKINEIYLDPPLSANTWIEAHSWIELTLFHITFIFAEPSSTFLVYFLGLVAISYGIHLIRKRDQQKSLMWWGIALCFWGLGAIFAGTSYQAFSYELKCANQENCLWTTWWEIIYLLLSVASVNSMMMAQSYSCATEREQFRMQIYGFVNLIIYLIMLIVGMFLPIKFMLSFELMVLFLIPSFIFFMIQNSRRYLSEKKKMDLILIRIWLLLACVMVLYYGYFLLGFSERFWNYGIWFTANDVLHIGLILWMFYIGQNTFRHVRDFHEDQRLQSGLN